VSWTASSTAELPLPLSSYFASQAHSGLFGVEKVTPGAFDAATKQPSRAALYLSLARSA